MLRRRTPLRAKSSLARRTPMRRVSKKRAVDNRRYLQLRKQYLEDHPFCELKLSGCETYSNQIHHRAGRHSRLCDYNNFTAACNPCHDWVTRHGKKARQMGLIIELPKNES